MRYGQDLFIDIGAKPSSKTERISRIAKYTEPPIDQEYGKSDIKAASGFEIIYNNSSKEVAEGNTL